MRTINVEGRWPMVSALALDRAVLFRALAEDFVLCSWVRHFIFTVPLSPKVHK